MPISKNCCIFAAILKCTRAGRGWYGNYRELAAAMPFVMSHETARTPEQQAAYDRQTVAFYDIDKKAWRSMRIDTIWTYHRALKLTE